MSTHSARVKARGELPEAISPLLPQVGLCGECSLQLVSCWPLHRLTAMEYSLSPCCCLQLSSPYFSSKSLSHDVMLALGCDWVNLLLLLLFRKKGLSYL